jgi:hypothetical protein
MLKQLVRKPVRQAVVDNPAFTAGLHKPGSTKQLERVTRLVQGDVQRHGQISDAQFVNGDEGKQQPSANRVCKQAEEPTQSLSIT